MKNKYNPVCLIVSLLPIIVLAFFYNRLIAFPNTHISGSNGLTISKTIFVFVIVGSNILWYYISLFLSQRLAGLNTLVNGSTLRVLINLLFPVLSILLILANTQ